MRALLFAPRPRKTLLTGLLAAFALGSLVACSSTTETTTTKSDKVGVAECDDYIAKLAACIPKSPSEQRPTLEAGMKASKAAWQAAAAAPDQDKDVLRRQCKTMLDSLQTMPACATVK